NRRAVGRHRSRVARRNGFICSDRYRRDGVGGAYGARFEPPCQPACGAALEIDMTVGTAANRLAPTTDPGILEIENEWHREPALEKRSEHCRVRRIQSDEQRVEPLE